MLVPTAEGITVCVPEVETALPFSVTLVALVEPHVRTDDCPKDIEAGTADRLQVGICETGGVEVAATAVVYIISTDP